MIAPEPFYRLYPHDRVPLPVQYWTEASPHPAVEAFRDAAYWERLDEATVRKAVAAYYGLVSFLDDNIGRLLQTLADLGLADDTRVIYTSDHGENLGNHSLWGKSVMYEDSAGVPMIVAGPDIPEGEVVTAPVSLVDCHPTLLDAVGAVPNEEEATLPGHSLFSLAHGERPPLAQRPRRAQFSHGDLVALAAIRDLVRGFGVKASSLASASRDIFEVCNSKPWPALARCRLEIGGDTAHLGALKASPCLNRNAIVLLPLGPIIDEVGRGLLGAVSEESDGFVPVMSQLRRPL